MIHNFLLTLLFCSANTVQAYCWSILLANSNVVGIAKTGSGKTLAFLLPAFILCEMSALARLLIWAYSSGQERFVVFQAFPNFVSGCYFPTLSAVRLKFLSWDCAQNSSAKTHVLIFIVTVSQIYFFSTHFIVLRVDIYHIFGLLRI